eukprot:450173-Pelagomonas_calceolata.AAC.2
MEQCMCQICKRNLASCTTEACEFGEQHCRMLEAQRDFVSHLSTSLSKINQRGLPTEQANMGLFNQER